MKKIKKLNWGDDSGFSKKEYEKKRKEYIAEYTEWESGGFFQAGGSRHKPEVGSAKWDSIYPNGYEDWLQARSINFVAFLNLIEKVDEIIDRLNK